MSAQLDKLLFMWLLHGNQVQVAVKKVKTMVRGLYRPLIEF